AGQLVPAGGIGGGEAVKGGGGIGRPPEFHQLAVELLAPALRDDVDNAAGTAAVLGREGIGQDGHLLDGGERDGAEDGLAAPTVVAGAAIHHEGGLASSGAVGSEQVLVEEDVALVDGRAVCRVEQRKRGNLAAE